VKIRSWARQNLLPLGAVLASLGFFQPAHASELAVLGVLTQTAPQLVDSTSDTSFSAAAGYGVGFQFSASVFGRLELELGAQYVQRSWTDTVSGTLLMPAFDFPVGVRLRIARWLALDAGGYYSSMNAAARVSYISTIDYGAFAGAQLMVPLGARGALFFAGRYLYGIANVSTIGGQLSFRGFEALGGYQFNLSTQR
jgi:hypothetical protein